MPSNLERSERIAKIVTDYEPISGEDPDDAIRDLMTDIRHYCLRYAVDFKRAMYHSETAFVREIEGESDFRADIRTEPRSDATRPWEVFGRFEDLDVPETEAGILASFALRDEAESAVRRADDRFSGLVVRFNPRTATGKKGEPAK